jgi:hypothetical protein
MNRILRIFKIWGERSVYNEEFLTDLRGLLTAKKATPATPQSKQSEQQASSGLTTGEFIVIIIIYFSPEVFCGCCLTANCFLFLLFDSLPICL